MAIDFPASPAAGQRYTFNGVNYVFTAQGVWSVVNTGLPAASTSAVTVQKFTANGSYTMTPGTQFIVVECVGGGGGGGGASGQAGSYHTGGGGGSGGYSRKYLTAAQVGGSQPVTIGVGGAGGGAPGGVGGVTSFGSLCIANGGIGGFPTSASGASISGYGGQGGAPGTGDIAAAGSPGAVGQYSADGNVVSLPGQGGSSAFGGGGMTSTFTQSAANDGAPGRAYGGGGCGAFAANASVASLGGNGSPGICIVTEYNIAAAGPQGPAGPMGGTTGVSAPGGRLTLSPTLPVLTNANSLTSQSSIYYLPYIGDRIPIWDGSQMVMTTIPAGLNCVTTDTAKNPNAIGVNKNNDWYVWLDGGTVRLSHGPDWGSNTARSPAPVPVMLNGIWTNGANITNGPPQNRGTYVGTTQSDNNSLLNFRFGTQGTPGVGNASLFMVWNTYNRVEVAGLVSDTSGSWSFGSNIWRQANANPGMAHAFIAGLAEDVLKASYGVRASTNNAGAAFSGVFFDSTTVPTPGICGGYGSSSTAYPSYQVSEVALVPSIGAHFVAACETEPGQVGCIFYGSGVAGVNSNAFNFVFKM